MDEIIKAIPWLIGLFTAFGAGFKYFGHIGKKYENAAANMRGDVKAIESQEILNENLADTITRQQTLINHLQEKLEHEQHKTDEWREKYFALKESNAERKV